MAKKGRSMAFLALFRALRDAARPGGPSLWESLRAVPRLVAATLTGRYAGTSRGQLGLLGLGVLYVFSPIDLLPDFLPVIGIADDAVVVTWLVGRLLVETREFLRWERGERTAATSGAADQVISGHVVRG